MAELKKKRERSANFSPDEVNTLISIISDHREIIECKKSDGKTWRQKELAWDTVTECYNSCCVIARSKKALRKKYEDIKKNIRKRHAHNKTEQLKSNGGRPDLQAFTIAEEMLTAIAGSTIDGNSSVWDSDSTPKLSVIKEKSTPEVNDESQTMEIDNQGPFEDVGSLEYLKDDVDEVILEKGKVNSTKDIVDKSISILKGLITPESVSVKKIKKAHNNDQYLRETERKEELHKMRMSILRQEMEINKSRLQAARLDIEIKRIQKQAEEARLQKLL